jgi:hypothetical protein
LGKDIANAQLAQPDIPCSFLAWQRRFAIGPKKTSRSTRKSCTSSSRSRASSAEGALAWQTPQKCSASHASCPREIKPRLRAPESADQLNQREN